MDDVPDMEVDIMKNKKIFKRITAMMTLLTLAFLLPAGNLYQYNVQAATNDRKYISEIKLYISNGAVIESAQKWCDDQSENKDKDKENDWKVIEGDINEGAGGMSGKNVGVFICYRTTTDPDEAIRDMAVMNEKGNYSEGAYDRLLSEQKDMYMDMVKDMKEMLEEYKTNYEKKIPTAVKAHDFLNGYVEDDSKEPLGDLLLHVTDEKLAELLLQMNGNVVLTIQQQLASACDTGKSTWLDRMEQIGSFSGLRKQFLKAYNKNASKADAALRAKYHDKAVLILECWDDLHQHFDNINKFIKKNNLDKLTDEELEKWTSENFDDDNGFVFTQEFSTLMALAEYNYITDETDESKDGSLLDYFSQEKKDFVGNNIRKLYPLAACLSDGQIAALSENVSLFNILQDALGAGLYNNYKSGMGATIKEKVNSEEKKSIEKINDYIDETVEDWNGGGKICVYEG